MHLPQALGTTLTWWSSTYSDDRLVSVSVRFLHIAGLVIGGGTSVATDRVVLRAWHGDQAARSAALGALTRAHRTVVPALVIVVATGVLMTAADTATFFASPIYWTKIALVALLFANGAGLIAAERAAGRLAAWRRLAIGSAASLVLWVVLLFVGTLLTAAS
jgi:hypothetical protein